MSPGVQVVLVVVNQSLAVAQYDFETMMCFVLHHNCAYVHVL